MKSSRRILISHPGFSNFHKYFVDQSSEDIFTHRNYDQRAWVFKICKWTGLLNLLVRANTASLVRKFISLNCDELIIIKGSTIDCSLLKLKDLRFNVYLWDSVSNIFGGEKYLEIPDRVSSFDPEDCNLYGFRYLPLFHFRGSEPAKINEGVLFERNKLTLYGNYSPDRVRILVDILKLPNLRYEVEFFLTISPYLFIREVVFGRKSIKQLLKYTTFRQLKRRKIEEMLESSVATLDIANVRQSGMTTRTLEAISHSTKLVTNNQTTVNFCKALNIPVMFCDFKNLDVLIDTQFFEKGYKVGETFISEYSIDNFISKIVK